MSTGKTKTLELSQWVYSDPFRMEEMNEAFRRIDAAVEGLEKKIEEAGKAAETGGLLVKLMEKTLSGSSASAELNFSGIDLTNIIELRIYYPHKLEGVNFTVNSYTGNMQITSSTGAWNNTGISGNANGDRLTVVNAYGLGSTKGNIYFYGIKGHCVPASAAGRLQRLTFTCGGSAAFQAGDRFVVFGVRL